VERVFVDRLAGLARSDVCFRPVAAFAVTLELGELLERVYPAGPRALHPQASLNLPVLEWQAGLLVAFAAPMQRRERWCVLPWPTCCLC